MPANWSVTLQSPAPTLVAASRPCPTSTGRRFRWLRSLQPRHSCKLPRRNPHGHGNYSGIHLPRLQQPQVRPSPVSRQYSYLTRNAWDWSDQRTFGRATAIYGATEGDQQHGLHQHALLHPLTSVHPQEKASFGVPFLLRQGLPEALLRRASPQLLRSSVQRQPGVEACRNRGDILIPNCSRYVEYLRRIVIVLLHLRPILVHCGFVQPDRRLVRRPKERLILHILRLNIFEVSLRARRATPASPSGRTE